VFKPIYHLNVFYTQLEGVDNVGLAEVCNSIFDNERQMTEIQNSERRLDGDNEHVKKLRKSVGEVIKKEIDHRLVEGDMWAHVLRQGDTTMIHTHRNKKDWALLDISWVYYATNNPNTHLGGRIVFQTQVGGVKTVHKDWQPKPGDLIIFPSWLPHFTTHNMSPDIRVSISGNYNISSLPEPYYNEVAYDANTNIKKLTGLYQDGIS